VPVDKAAEPDAGGGGEHEVDPEITPVANTERVSR
jgi:hypothetical protein